MAEPGQTAQLMADGSSDFTGGVDSGRVPTIKSASNPNGLDRTQLAWLNNGTVRGGAISQRDVFQQLARVAGSTGMYQGSKLYVPLQGDPYYLALIGGHVLQISCDSPYTIVDLSAKFKLTHPPNNKAYFCQGNQFVVIQAGDWQPNNSGTLPLFWDGTTLSRSVGIISPNNVPGTAPLGVMPFNQLPGALAMTFYHEQFWYAQGNVFSAGDISGDQSSGTAPYKFTDSVLYVTESPLAVGGDGFHLPQSAGQILALSYTANLDSTLGQGPLYAFTATQIWALTVPLTRDDWIGVTGSNLPQLIPVQLKYGAVSDRSVVHVNGDLFYATLEPAIRSLIIATRFFGQWANTPISRNERRVLDFTISNLMFSAPAINFDNRLLQGVMPIKVAVGIAYQALMPLDFDILSTFGSEGVTPTGTFQSRLPPAWEGMWQGLNFLDMDVQPFAGADRAFALVSGAVDGSIWLYEILADEPNGPTTDSANGSNNRITTVVETPAYVWEKQFLLKRLEGGELFLDGMTGKVDIQVDYRPDSSPCWYYWFQKSYEISQNTVQSVAEPVGYPAPPIVPPCDGYKFPMVLPKPPMPKTASMTHRTVDIGYQFQVRITIVGSCRVRGWLFYAAPRYQAPYEGLNK